MRMRPHGQRLRALRTNEWSRLGRNFPRLAHDAIRAGAQFHQRATAEIAEAAEQDKPAPSRDTPTS